MKLRLGFFFLALLSTCTLLPIARAATYPVGAARGTLGAANAAVTVSVTNQASCVTTVPASGNTLSGTIIFEQSGDNGTTWTGVTSFPDPGISTGASQTFVNPSAANYSSPVSASSLFRVRVSAYSSGSVAGVGINCSTGPLAQVNNGQTPPPSPATGFVLLQPSSPPATSQPGNIGVTGIYLSGSGSSLQFTMNSPGIIANTSGGPGAESEISLGGGSDGGGPVDFYFPTYCATPYGTNNYGLDLQGYNVPSGGEWTLCPDNNAPYNLDFLINDASVPISFTQTGTINAAGAMAAGSATAPTLTAGDLGASRSASTGAISIGGTTNSVKCDYGVTTSNNMTCAITNAGHFIFSNSGGSVLTAQTSGISTSGTITASALSNSTTTTSYVPPVYTNAGAIVGSTYHGSQFSCTFAAATSCALGASYWTGAAVFVTIEGCAVASTGTGAIAFSVGNVSTATATIYASASNSQTVTGICWGT